MLNLWGSRRESNCDGSTRRDFLKVGAIGMTGLVLPELLRARARASAAGKPTRSTSVIWLWLGGGPTHIETFDPKMSAPSEYRSALGAIKTNVTGIELGAVFPRMAQVADKMAFVRSFAHNNSGHGGGTHWVMTGYDYPPADNNQAPIKPGLAPSSPASAAPIIRQAACRLMSGSATPTVMARPGSGRPMAPSIPAATRATI